ncbi:MAG: hypothetical protein AAGE43_04795 [Pseudomonadota bacterium]
MSSSFCAVRRLQLLLSVAFAAVLLGGCSEAVEQQASYESIVDSKQMMNWILDPNADVIWGSAGTITTFEGVEDLTPTTQEGWDAVRNAAATLAEAGNLLKIPGHSQGEDWNEISGGLTRTAVRLIEAAEQKDGQAVFDYGGQLYNVCVSCHQLYMLPEDE